MPGVTGLRLSVAEGDGEGPAYTLGSGLVRASSVVQPAPEAAADTGPLVAASAPAPEPYVGDPLTDQIPAQPIEPAAPTSGPAAYVPPVPEVVPPAEPGAPAPASGIHAAEPAVASTPVARLVFSTGEVVDVDRPVVVGRAPRLRGDGDDETRLVTVPSPHQEISSTHLEIRPGSAADQGSAVVTDLGSTNGTLVVQPGLPAEDLQPGIAVQLLPGAIVDLGEGVTIQVAGV